MSEQKKWKTLDSRFVVNDRWLKLRADSVQTPDGHTLDPFYIFEYPDWINCLVVDSDFNAVLLKHYRHGAKEFVSEIVGGVIEEGETPQEAIERELLEELGYTGGQIFQTGVSYANPANQTNKVFSFLAVGGSRSEEQTLEKGETLEIDKVPLKEALRRFTAQESGEVYQSLHLANVFFALNFIKNSNKESIQKLKKIVES